MIDEINSELIFIVNKDFKDFFLFYTLYLKLINKLKSNYVELITFFNDTNKILFN